MGTNRERNAISRGSLPRTDANGKAENINQSINDEVFSNEKRSEYRNVAKSHSALLDIVDHEFNPRTGDWNYRVHRDGTDDLSDTWGKLRSLPTRTVIDYHEANQLPLPWELISDTTTAIIDKIVATELRDGEQYYKVRWYDRNADADTWEPISHLPRSKILSFHKR